MRVDAIEAVEAVEGVEGTLVEVRLRDGGTRVVASWPFSTASAIGPFGADLELVPLVG
jgi:hypothetical protein